MAKETRKREVARDGTGWPLRSVPLSCQGFLSPLTVQSLPPQPHSAAKEVGSYGFYSSKPENSYYREETEVEASRNFCLSTQSMQILYFFK